MGKSHKKSRSDRVNALRKQYDVFLDEDRKRKERNEYIIDRLEKMRYTVSELQSGFKNNNLVNERNIIPLHYAVPAVFEENTPPGHQTNRSLLPVNLITKNAIEENLLLKEIGKKFILIPKLNATSYSIQETHEPDNDWKNKYNILDQLKTIEKEGSLSMQYDNKSHLSENERDNLKRTVSHETISTDVYDALNTMNTNEKQIIFGKGSETLPNNKDDNLYFTAINNNDTKIHDSIINFNNNNSDKFKDQKTNEVIDDDKDVNEKEMYVGTKHHGSVSHEISNENQETMNGSTNAISVNGLQNTTINQNIKERITVLNTVPVMPKTPGRKSDIYETRDTQENYASSEAKSPQEKQNIINSEGRRGLQCDIRDKQINEPVYNRKLNKNCEQSDDLDQENVLGDKPTKASIQKVVKNNDQTMTPQYIGTNDAERSAGHYEQPDFEQYNQTATDQYYQSATDVQEPTVQSDYSALQQYDKAAPVQYAEAAPEQFDQTNSDQYNYTVPEQYDQLSAEQHEMASGKYNQMPSEEYGQTLRSQYDSIPIEQYDQTASEQYEKAAPEQHGHTVPQQYDPITSEQYDETATGQYDSSALEQYNQIPSEHNDRTGSEEYEQTASQEYNRTAPEQYEQTAPQEYDQTAPEQYEQTAPQEYNQTAPEQYEQTGPQEHNQTAPEQYEQTAPQEYNQTAPEQYEQTAPQEYDQTVLEQYEHTAPQQFDQTNSEQYGQTHLLQYEPTALEHYNQTALEQYDQIPSEQYRQESTENYDQITLEQHNQYDQSVAGAYNDTNTEQYDYNVENYDQNDPQQYEPNNDQQYQHNESEQNHQEN